MLQYDNMSENGLRMESGTLFVDSSIWNIDKKIVIFGVSQLCYYIDYLGYNREGDKFVVLDNSSKKGVVLEEALMIMSMKVDVQIPTMFVIVPSDEGVQKHRSSLGQRGIIPIREIVIPEPPEQNTGPLVVHEERGETRKPFASQRRDRLSVMVDIMELLDDRGSRITNIIYKCNLNYRSGLKIIDELIKKGYVKTEVEESVTKYSITQSGSEALMYLRKYGI